mmetsp:Transcript_26344/g.76566  ORF Transcript_26344/g.76566 Transcript_26344/m.76566 type:complete len:290 (-) Transcript_26344:637-1506(-)
MRHQRANEAHEPLGGDERAEERGEEDAETVQAGQRHHARRRQDRDEGEAGQRAEEVGRDPRDDAVGAVGSLAKERGALHHEEGEDGDRHEDEKGGDVEEHRGARVDGRVVVLVAEADVHQADHQAEHDVHDEPHPVDARILGVVEAEAVAERQEGAERGHLRAAGRRLLAACHRLGDLRDDRGALCAVAVLEHERRVVALGEVRVDQLEHEVGRVVHRRARVAVSGKVGGDLGGLAVEDGVAAREQQDVVKEGPELAARLVDGERNGVPGARHRLEPLHHAKGGGRVEA